MSEELLQEYISPNPNAKILVLIGGNPFKRDEVIRDLKIIDNLSIYGTLSEEEAYKKISELKNVDLVLIGGRYSEEQRVRIRNFLKANFPNTELTEPGIDYSYDTELILLNVKKKLKVN